MKAFFRRTSLGLVLATSAHAQLGGDPIVVGPIGGVQLPQEPAAPAAGVGLTTVPGQAHTVEFRVAPKRLPRRGAVWRFGDGTQAPATALTRHDYSRAMNHGRPVTEFRATLVDSLGTVLESVVVRVVSTIALARELGFAQAEVRPAVVEAPTCGLDVRVSLTNREAESVTYDRFLRQLSPCDPAEAPFIQEVTLETMIGGVGADPPLSTALIGQNLPGAPGRLTLQAGETRVARIALPCTDQAAVCVGSWKFVGQTRSGRKAYADFHAELGRNPHRIEAADKRMGRFLTALVDGGLVPAHTLRIDADMLSRLEAEGRIRNTPKGWEIVQ